VYGTDRVVSQVEVVSRTGFQEDYIIMQFRFRLNELHIVKVTRSCTSDKKSSSQKVEASLGGQKVRRSAMSGARHPSSLSDCLCSF